MQKPLLVNMCPKCGSRLHLGSQGRSSGGERIVSVLCQFLLAVVYSGEQQWDGFGNGKTLKRADEPAQVALSSVKRKIKQLLKNMW